MTSGAGDGGELADSVGREIGEGEERREGRENVERLEGKQGKVQGQR